MRYGVFTSTVSQKVRGFTGEMTYLKVLKHELRQVFSAVYVLREQEVTVTAKKVTQSEVRTLLPNLFD